jgi:hypothetical protein
LHHRRLHAPKFKPNEDKSYRDVGWRVHLDHRPSSGNGSFLAKLMALKEHMNNCARLAQPGIWIFRGKAMVLLVIGFALFILIMQCLRAVQLEMPIAIVISALPTLGLTVFVRFFVNDKPPSYAFDLLLFKIWRFKTWLFKAGVLSRPPGLWFLPETIRHPKEF